jgi:cellulose synthase/poly-beta-1,6-N-acetylglucosamine synthase-like glycosyltransferase
MGDSICFRADILRQFGWDQSLAEDFQLRLRLLLGGVRIAYEPSALGYGEAPPSWKIASVQRLRWLRGTRDASRRFALRMLREGLLRRDRALVDTALQVYLPSYSSLTLLSVAALGLQFLANQFIAPVFSWQLLAAWASVVGILFLYPVAGLVLERAPSRAFLALLLGPFFVLWRTFLAAMARGRREISWIPTQHGQ